MQLTLRFFQKKPSAYRLTIYQTPSYGDTNGHQPVYRTMIGGKTHQDVLEKAFSTFNVHDTVPNDYNARFITTGDIVEIDDRKKGKCYYQLFPTGWKRSERIKLMS
ncbi:YodL domain-containing protein [Bacillus sp. NPDC093026]|uniref:YodL domain-containing protein n=1 Tax=Bacillus sp. NPDC093026 TaxID=3363948 RepID=UPI0038148D2F